MLAASTVLSSSVACGLSEVTKDTVAWQGEHIRYYSSESIQVCDGTREYVDGFVPFLAGELGIAIPEGLQYVWSDDPDLVEDLCNIGPQCSKKLTALTASPALLHEVVHGVAYPAKLNRWAFFAEGLAEAYDPFVGDGIGPTYLQTPENGPLPDPRPLMTFSRDELRNKAAADGSNFNYQTAGSFTAFLLARHGPEKFVTMVPRLGRTRSMQKLRDTFREVYEVELDDEVEAFIHGAPCEEGAFPVRLYDCVAPEVPWADDARWLYTGTLACDDGDLVGGIAPSQAPRSIRSRSITIPEDGPYQVRLEGEGDVIVQLGACFGCPWEARNYYVAPGGTITPVLDAGHYYIRIQGDSAASSTLQLEIAPSPPGSG